MNYLNKTGIIKNGNLFVNNTNFNLKKWRVKVYKDKDYIILLEKFINGNHEYWYDFMVEKEEYISEFFEETDWEIEWEEKEKNEL